MLNKLLKIVKIVLIIETICLMAIAVLINVQKSKAYQPMESKHYHRGTLDFTTICEASSKTPELKQIKKTSEVFSEPQQEREEKEPEPKWIMVMATAYTSAEEENGGFGAHDCKFGFDLIDGEHIASDLAFLPYGTRVYIEGLGERTVVDTASQKTISRVNKMARERDCEGWIDVYMGDRAQDMDDWGIKVVRLYVIE